MSDEYEGYKPYGGLKEGFAGLAHWAVIRVPAWLLTQLLYLFLFLLYVYLVLDLLLSLLALYEICIVIGRYWIA